MAAGESYPATFTDQSGLERFDGNINYTDSGDQPAPQAPPITSGSLPTTGSWVSGTAKVNPVGRTITVYVEVVTDGTANVATCAIALSPDDSTYTTVGTPGVSAAVNTVGAVTTLVPVVLPQGWYIKLTLTHAAVASSKYA